MTRYLSLAALTGLTVLAACGASDLTAPSSATQAQTANADREGQDPGGQAGSLTSAETCKKGGYLAYTRTDLTTFSNQGECVSYVVRGGTLVPVSVIPTITSFTFDGLENTDCSAPGGVRALFTAVFPSPSGTTATITDAAGVVTPVTSGQPVALSPNGGNFTLTVTNGSGSVSQTLIDPILGPGGVLGCPGGGGGVIRQPPSGLGRVPGGV